VACKHALYQRATYLKSVGTLDQLPSDEGYEVAFIGRSNAGKSSALNTITGIKSLARTSKTPGRTQTINLFTLDDERRLADLPGYGYAKVPLVVKQRWEHIIDTYLQTRHCLRALVVVMDVRHPLKEIDRQIIAWAASCGIPTHVLLTKADKLKPNEARKTLKQVGDDLNIYGNISLQLFSSLKKQGIEEAHEKLNEWMEVITTTKE
jgi:GTP-binding protein